MPDGPLVLRVSKLGLCLLDCENFFFEVKLLVASFLLLFKRLDLFVDFVQFILSLLRKVGKLVRHNVLQFVQQIICAFQSAIDFFLPLPPFSRERVDVCLTAADGPQILRLRMERLLDLPHLILLRVLAGILLFQQSQLGFQKLDFLFVRFKVRIGRAASATTGRSPGIVGSVL